MMRRKKDGAKGWLKDFINEHRRVIGSLDQKAIMTLIEMLEGVRDSKKQIFIIGNGGSAANGSHLMVDLGKGASAKKKGRFRVFAPAENVSWLTAIGNDLGFDNVFVEQIENFAQKGDLLLALSVSGKSPNIVKAVKRAKRLGLKTAGLLGDYNAELISILDAAIVVPSKHYAHVEDAHAVICHILSYYFMEMD